MTGLRRGRARRVAGLVALAVAALVGAAGAQEAPAGETEDGMLRRAATLETRGEYGAAAEVLRRLLERSPTSTTGVFALERVLRARGRAVEILPVLDAFLTRDPTHEGVRSLHLRVLVEMDSLAAADRAASAWIEADPRSLEPYREAARFLEAIRGSEAALDVLRRGRSAVGSPEAFALEIGDVLVRLGREEEGAREWARAVSPGGEGGAGVLRRIDRLGDPDAVRALLEALGEGGGGGRLRTAARIAADRGLEEEALDLAERALPDLEGAEVKGFLLDLGARGESRGLHRVTRWALERLRERTAEPGELRALDEALSGAALALGDTVGAAEAMERAAASLPAGSPERRRALARVIGWEAAFDVPAALERLAAFREEFPDAPEIDPLSSSLAARLQGSGRAESAGEVLRGVEGPRAALERAYLALAAGEVQRGRAALLEALPGLAPSEATGVIELAAYLGEAGEAGAGLAGRAAARVHRGEVEGALGALDAGMEGVGPEDRPGLLALAASWAEEGGRPDRAAALRRRLVAEHGDAAEAPAALLALARHRARAGDVGEALSLLEELILERPESPLVPQARRELERLRREGGGR